MQCGYGITNLVNRATLTIEELSKEELIEGSKPLILKVKEYKPDFLAVLGIDSYRKAFERSKAVPGLQPERINGTKIWLLPNPSGRNAAFKPADFAEMFRQLRIAAESSRA